MDLDFTDPFRTFNRYQNAAFRYNSLEISSCSFWDAESRKVMTKYANDLSRLILASCTFDRSSPGSNPESIPITNIFRSLKKLEYLTMVNVTYHSNFRDFKYLELNNLKTIVMSDSSLEVNMEIVKSYFYLLNFIHFSCSNTSSCRSLQLFMS